MVFLTDDDIRVELRDTALTQITDNDPTIKDTAEADAMARVVNACITANYDHEAIFAAQGNQRNRTVVRWMRCLVIYFLYGRIADNMIPDRVIKNYNDVLTELERVEDGKYGVPLPKILNEDEEYETKFRWGGQKARSH